MAQVLDTYLYSFLAFQMKYSETESQVISPNFQRCFVYIWLKASYYFLNLRNLRTLGPQEDAFKLRK